VMVRAKSYEQTIPLKPFPQHQERDLALRMFKIEELRHLGVDRHEFYNILWITAGTGTHYIDFKGYPVLPNTIYCMAPGQAHLWDVREEICGHSLIFTEDCLLLDATNPSIEEELGLFNAIVGDSLSLGTAATSPLEQRSPSISLSAVQAARLQPIIDLLWQEYDSLELNCEAAVRSLLQVFLVRLQRYSSANNSARLPTADQRSTSGANRQLTDRFRQLLERHFLEYQTVQAYAESLGVTANHLSESVKATTGLPAGTVIRQRSILEAKRLLVYTDRSVQQIANLLNFPDPSYFGRFFKRETAQSPIAFRRTIRQKYHIYQD
jgi:AraC family transcriptional regulator, transcriptional activator of pobA